MKTKNSSIKISAYALAIFLSVCTAGQAAVIANWENDNVTSTDLTTAADTVAAGVTSSVLTQNIGSTGAWTDALSGVQNGPTINSLATAITANDYFSFTITPDSGKKVSYSDLFLRYSVGANTAPATTVFTLLSSKTGFTSADGLDTVTAALPSGASIVGTDTFTLGQALLQNVTTAVEFRIYAHNTGTNAMTRIAIGHLFATNGTDDLTLNGAIANIPEPTTWALLTLGLTCVTVFRRRRA